CNCYDNVKALFDKEQPEIISVCVPDEHHCDYLKDIIRFRPKAVIAEKPLTKDLATSRQIVTKYTNAGIPLFVNYSRRYDEPVQKTKRMIEDGEFGEILHASFRYTKGILHNGSHAIDLANYLFGNVLSAKTLSAVYDHSDSDPTLNAYLSYEKCRHLFLIACDERSYSIFELDILSDKKRIFFDQFGLKYTEYMLRNNLACPGYKELAKGRTQDTGLGSARLNLVENVINHLEKGEEIICSGEDALYAQKICDDLLRSYHKDIKNA
ncbi:MAG TPA: Gfo/Idh/MocA family oxidoreductase, partial [bacterium]|nr:Gfo/Idh/MocA family oxidoreductase [bacterium]